MNKTWRAWTPLADEVMRLNYGHVSTRQLAKVLGHRMSGIHRRAVKLGLTQRERQHHPFVNTWGHDEFGCHRPHHRHCWRPMEVAKLELWYGNLPATVIATRLGRSVHGVRSKARVMGIRYSENREGAA